MYSGPECAVKVSSAQTVTLVTVCTSGPSKAGQAGSAPEPEPGVTLYIRRRALVGRLHRRRAGESLSWPERAGISPHPFVAWQHLPPSLSLPHLVVLPRGNYFYERITGIIMIITLSITTGKPPFITQLPPTLIFNNHCMIVCV